MWVTETRIISTLKTYLLALPKKIYTNYLNKGKFEMIKTNL